MEQTGQITVTKLHSTPGLLIESTKVNVFCATAEQAIEQFCKAILWNRAIMQNKV